MYYNNHFLKPKLQQFNGKASVNIKRWLSMKKQHTFGSGNWGEGQFCYCFITNTRTFTRLYFKTSWNGYTKVWQYQHMYQLYVFGPKYDDFSMTYWYLTHIVVMRRNDIIVIMFSFKLPHESWHVLLFVVNRD